MKYSYPNILSSLLFSLSLSFLMMSPLKTYADDVNAVQHQSRLLQQLYSTPQEALKSLQIAAEANDRIALRGIFGPDIQDLLTGDKVQDAKNAHRFAKVMAQAYILVQEGNDKLTIEMGPNHWPMPIPLIRVNGYWRFDTEAGKQEIINRHIGKDELHAIAICIDFAKKESQHPHSKLQAPKPVHGYCFKTVNQGQLSNGVILVAYPMHWGKSGIMTFIVNLKGHVYQQNFGASTIEIVPTLAISEPDEQWTLVQDQN